MLGHVLATPIASADWYELVHMLRIRAEAHAAREENELVPFLRDGLSAAEYRGLAGAFATERLRQLSMLQPSAPVTMPRELVH
jgi:plasmid stability protein